MTEEVIFLRHKHKYRPEHDFLKKYSIEIVGNLQIYRPKEDISILKEFKFE